MFESVESKIQDLKVGQTYPFYGAMEEIKENGSDIVVSIYPNLELSMIIPDKDRRELLKSRAFDPGIFIGTVTAIVNGRVKANCQTVVFGRKGLEQ